MADAMDTLKNILGDDAEDKIKTVMNSLSSGIIHRRGLTAQTA